MTDRAWFSRLLRLLVVSEMTYTVSSGTLNSTIPFTPFAYSYSPGAHTGPCFTGRWLVQHLNYKAVTAPC